MAILESVSSQHRPCTSPHHAITYIDINANKLYFTNTAVTNTAVTGVGSSPALATYDTSQVLLEGVSGGFLGVLPFRPTYRLARLNMSEIILKGTLN